MPDPRYVLQHRTPPFPKTPRSSRRPSRVTIVVATATAATALLTAAAAASGSASTRPLASGLPAVSTGSVAVRPGTIMSPAAPAKPAAATTTAHGIAHAAPARATGRTHLTVNVGQRGSGQARHQAAVRHPAAAKARHKPAAPSRPYRMYDSVTPAAIPAHQAAAVYSTGAYYATPGQIRHLGHALWIDTTGRNYNASVLDVEPGDATPSQAASWAWHRLRANHHALARIYTMLSQWPAVQSAVHGLPSWMQHQVRYWIADPTGVPHIVPGSHATQWYWGSRYDISTVKPGF